MFIIQVCSRYGKYQALLYNCYRSPLFTKPRKKQQSLRFKFAEAKSHLRLWKWKKLPQTCGFAVADHPLLFCGCRIEFKFAVPSTDGMEWNENFSMEYGRFKEWNGRQPSIPIPYYILCMLFTEKYTCIVTNNIFLVQCSVSFLLLFVCIAQTVYVLHHSKYIAICSINAVADGFGRFD